MTQSLPADIDTEPVAEVVSVAVGYGTATIYEQIAVDPDPHRGHGVVIKLRDGLYAHIKITGFGQMPAEPAPVVSASVYHY